MKILVAGDSYCPARTLQRSMSTIAAAHELTYVDVADDPIWRPSSLSERRLHEYLGTPAQLIEALIDHEALVVQGAPISDQVLDAAPLRVVCVTRGGPVNVDMVAATARKIPVVITPGKNAVAVAELTMALMVMVARRIPEAIRHVESHGEYGRDNYEGANWFGHDLAGKTLGVIGFGRVGKQVVSRSQAFGMRALVHDPYVAAEDIHAAGAEAAELVALLHAADFVSLHARATNDNRAMIGKSELAAMKPGSYLINTARGSLVDEDALGTALRSGQLAGAAYDVASPSEAGTKHRLLHTPNVVLLPHIGGATLETLANGGRMAAAELERFAAGHPLENVANRVELAQRGVIV
jgi:D-3-phosphoglycerate dehydrogenase